MRLTLLAAVGAALTSFAHAEEDGSSDSDKTSERPEPMCPTMADLTAGAGFHPWTHKPHCRKVIANAENKLSKNQTYCLFTRATAKRGFSVLTTPEVGAAIEKKADFSEHDARAQQEPGSVSSSSEVGDKYEIRDVAERGVGLFAARDIAPGETFMTDLPTLVAHRDALYTLSDDDRQEMLWRGLLQLPAKAQKLTRHLAKNYDPSRSRDGDDVDRVLQTNSIGITLGTPELHLGVLPESARINHACRPNAYYRFEEKTLSLRVFALKDIKKGEEINFNYGFLEAKHERRQELLSEAWGFECKCAKCSASKEEIAASDARLDKLQEAKKELNAAKDKPSAFLKQVGTILDLYDEEEMIMPMGMFAQIGAFTAVENGEEELAVKYAKLAKHYLGIMAGEDSGEVEGVEEILKDPKKHGDWRKKIKEVEAEKKADEEERQKKAQAVKDATAKKEAGKVDAQNETAEERKEI